MRAMGFLTILLAGTSYAGPWPPPSPGPPVQIFTLSATGDGTTTIYMGGPKWPVTVQPSSSSTVYVTSTPVTFIDKFTSPGSDTAKDLLLDPVKFWSVSVVTDMVTWSLSLQGSNDGFNFSTIVLHSDTNGTKTTAFNGVPTVARYVNMTMTGTGGTFLSATAYGVF